MCNHQWCRDVRRDEAVRAAEDAAAVPAIQHRDLPQVVAALTERVARLEAAQATLGTGDVFADVQCGSTADEIARLTAERDAAIRERRAANEEVEDWSRRCGRILDERDAARARVAELEAAPPPRGWLTAEERKAVEEAMVDYASNVGDHDCERIERVLRALLAREAPPRVKVPTVNAAWVDFLHERDGKWRDAIRAAGGEVE